MASIKIFNSILVWKQIGVDVKISMLESYELQRQKQINILVWLKDTYLITICENYCMRINWLYHSGYPDSDLDLENI